MRFANAHALLMNLPLVVDHVQRSGMMARAGLIYMQDEHNLVLREGRNVAGDAPTGVVRSIFDPEETYVVRVVGAEHYAAADVIVEYNMPNVENVRMSGCFPEAIVSKIVYAPSIPFAYSNERERGVDVLTNFVDESQPRRSAMMGLLKDRIPGYRNVRGVFKLPALRSLYSSAKILVNAHQTWHHHSIEEFRVLPALSRGCVVISEDVPLRERIPYHEAVIWCRYEEIPEVTAEVLSDYDAVFERIHGRSGLREVLRSMRQTFRNEMDAVMGRLGWI
jgi:hypothetical protein